MTGAEDLVRELNDAVEGKDWEAFHRWLDPDVVWLHNIGVGSPEEGEYRGRESVIALYERILEPWDYMRPVPTEVRERGGAIFVKGELHAKHGTSATELVTPYAQRLDLRDGLLTRGEMVTGPTAEGVGFEPTSEE